MVEAVTLKVPAEHAAVFRDAVEYELTANLEMAAEGSLTGRDALEQVVTHKRALEALGWDHDGQGKEVEVTPDYLGVVWPRALYAVGSDINALIAECDDDALDPAQAVVKAQTLCWLAEVWDEHNLSQEVAA